jgi:hypothetical protein
VAGSAAELQRGARPKQTVAPDVKQMLHKNEADDK